MTKKIFEVDPYMNQCFATIKEIKEIEDSTWISLDQTIFYPEGGGQPSDYGFINGLPILDVRLIDNESFYKVNGSIEKKRVKIEIDSKRRFDHMQQHTGQHLLSAVWLELYGMNTISFHLGRDICTIDLHTSEINDEQIRQVETKVAQYIFENRSVENYVLPYDEIDPEKLSKLKEKPEFVRFIEIEGIDTSTCCGTHVTMLGEVGLLKIIGWEKYKQNVRLSFISGLRAFSYFQEVFHAVNEVSKKLNVSPTLVTERFPSFYQGHQLLKKNYQKLYEQELHHEALKLINEADGNIIEVTFKDRPIQEIKDLAKIIIEAGDKVVILQNQHLSTWIFAVSSSKLFNVAECISILKETFGGKGGGNSVFGQWIGQIEDDQWQKIKSKLISI